MLKDLQEFLAKVQNDEALQDKMLKVIQASTQENVFDNCNAVAAELGYSIKEEDLQAYAASYKQDLKDDELDKVAGGTVYSAMFAVGTAVATGIIYVKDRVDASKR